MYGYKYSDAKQLKLYRINLTHLRFEIAIIQRFPNGKLSGRKCRFSVTSAFEKAAINAFVYNRWLDGNAPMFTAYQDRIEILSRGNLPPKQTMKVFLRENPFR
jgi:predicted HTH transcriptional regulator